MIELMAHTDHTWPSDTPNPVYKLHQQIDGRLIGLGRNPLSVAASRLAEEGHTKGTEFRIMFIDSGRTNLLGTL
jgi:hypothetical protein